MREKIKIWLEDAKETGKRRLVKIGNWVGDNKDILTVLIPVLVGSAVKLIKIENERAARERYIYDRSAGFYYELRRKPKGSEKALIDLRRKNGESLGMVLKDMRLLK